jgi:hypothetical protein
MTKHAVLTDDKLVFIHPSVRKLQSIKLDAPITHIAELWSQGQTTGITHFWIMPGTQFDTAGYDALATREGYSIFVPLMGTERQEDRPRSARCWKDQTGGGTHQVIVGYAGRYPFELATIERPLDMLACIDYLEQVLQIPVQWSPMVMGETYLRGLYSKTERLKSYLRPMTVDVSELPFMRASQDVRWKRQIKPLEHMGGEWIVMLDKNSAHPSAASSMTTGSGDPIHLDSEPEVLRPGAYRVSFDKGTSIFNGVSLPLVIEGEWITADVLKFARKQGYTVQVHECYIFEESHKLFTEWASDLWCARQLLKDRDAFCYEPGRLNAYHIMKDIMNRTISNQRKNPNWYADMVGCARTALLANFQKFTKEYDTFPFMAHHDDIAFICKGPEPEKELPGILARSDKMGGYKHKRSVKLNTELVNALNALPDDRRGSGRALTLLKEAASKQEVK